MSTLEGSAAYPSYPGRANFSYTFLTVFMRNKKIARLEGCPPPPPGVLLGIIGVGVPPGFSNPGPISDPKMSYFTLVFRPGLYNSYPF